MSDNNFNPAYRNRLTLCPFCGSNSFGDEQDESGDDLHYRTFRMHCDECDNEWYEEWKFTRRIELNEA